MQHKTFELIETKADDETGTFTALASVFGNVDKGGDRMMQGAFKNTLDKWRKSGKFIPIIVSHQWDDLNAWVGKADPRAIFEDERGLVVQGKLNMDEESGRKVHSLMKDGLLTGWSFGYSVPKGGQEKKNGANEVTEVDLFETGPTLVGMNPDAQLEAVKHQEKPESWMEAEGPEDPESEETSPEAIETESDGAHEEPSPAKSRSDTLREESRKVALKALSGGASTKKPTPPPVEPEPVDPDDVRELRRRSRAAVLKVLSGGQIHD